MNALGLFFYLESQKVQLQPAREGVRFRAPRGVLTDSLKRLAREHRENLAEMLQARRKFGYPGAELFPFIGHGVTIPQGSGELLSVFAKYCRVQNHRTGKVTLYSPGELIALAVSEFTEELAA